MNKDITAEDLVKLQEFTKKSSISTTRIGRECKEILLKVVEHLEDRVPWHGECCHYCE